jgi:hypothetical protein
MSKRNKIAFIGLQIVSCVALITSILLHDNDADWPCLLVTLVLGGINIYLFSKADTLADKCNEYQCIAKWAINALLTVSAECDQRLQEAMDAVEETKKSSEKE